LKSPISTTYNLKDDRLKKHLLNLIERYKVYAGEYKKPRFAIELFLTVKDDNETFPRTLADEFCQVYAFIDYMYETEGYKLEFMIHRGHFHPLFDQWYACEDTSSMEMVCLLQELVTKYVVM
jgi:hypothetical protein